MNKKIITYSLIAILFIAGAICLYPRGAKAGDPSTSSDTGVSGQTTHDQESAKTEANQESLLKSQPLPNPLTYSLERQNLIDKLKFEAKQGEVGYVALIGPMGQLVAYYAINGKVSSLNSYLTTTQQTEWMYSGNSGIASATVDSPDMDGSYGVNPPGIFFFTTSGNYIEWSGNYLYSDQPLSYTTAPVLVQSEGK
jgi:hypothetical protein